MADTYAPVPTTPDATSGFLARTAQGARRVRLTSLAFAILIEALIILLLFAIGWNSRDESQLAETLTTFEAQDFGPEDPSPQDEAPPEPEAQTAEPVPQPQVRPQPQLRPQPVVTPTPPLPPPPVAISRVRSPPPPTSAPAPAAPAAPASPPARVYGPPDTGGSNVGSDSQRVGSASNGEPLYAAQWYREPTQQEMAGYLSTATGPATALIACRTVANYRVEDCELIGESPQGSQIGRAVMAATWQFRVRPARIGGRSQVGSWVRIRIDYTLRGTANARTRGF